MRARFCVFALIAMLACGCASVQPLDPLNIVPIDVVVERLKCELRDAVVRYRHQPLYWNWMKDLTAKADLTFRVDALGGAATSNVFISALAPVGAVSQALNVGLNAGITDTSTRNAIMSFTLPLKYIDKFVCIRQPPGLDLTGDLGLSEWIASAIGGAEKADIFSGAESIAHDENEEIKKKNAGKDSDVVDAQEMIIDTENAILAQQKNKDKIVANLKKKSELEKNRPTDSIKIAPLDSLSQSVQFVIVANVNVAPNFTLVKYKGPANSSNLVSLQRTDTHILNVVLAKGTISTSSAGGGKPKTSLLTSPEHDRQLLNLQLQSIQPFLQPR